MTGRNARFGGSGSGSTGSRCHGAPAADRADGDGSEIKRRWRGSICILLHRRSWRSAPARAVSVTVEGCTAYRAWATRASTADQTPSVTPSPPPVEELPLQQLRSQPVTPRQKRVLAPPRDARAEDAGFRRGGERGTTSVTHPSRHPSSAGSQRRRTSPCSPTAHAADAHDACRPGTAPAQAHERGPVAPARSPRCLRPPNSVLNLAKSRAPPWGVPSGGSSKNVRRD